MSSQLLRDFLLVEPLYPAAFPLQSVDVMTRARSKGGRASSLRCSPFLRSAHPVVALPISRAGTRQNYAADRRHREVNWSIVEHRLDSRSLARADRQLTDREEEHRKDTLNDGNLRHGVV